MIELVLGGARAGKSTWALARVEALAPSGPIAFVATATAGDDEMAARIAAHRAERASRFVTVEEPWALPDRLPALAATHAAVVVDCLTLWVANRLLAVDARDDDVAAAIRALADALPGLAAPVVFVTNEVGLGIVPADPLTRRYRDHLGRCNQAVAAAADRVTLLVAGLPLHVKGGAP